MASKNQLSGMRGVYLVASELSKQGLITSTTSRSTFGADILVTDKSLSKAFSVQVKTNTRTFNHWLLNPKAKTQFSKSHIYVLVNIRKKKDKEFKETVEKIEYFIVPSSFVARKMRSRKRKKSRWYSIRLEKVKKYRDKWALFMKS